MAKPKNGSDDVASLLTDLLITQLAAGGVPQRAIREIIGCDGNRVSRITKHVKAAARTLTDEQRRREVASSEDEIVDLLTKILGVLAIQVSSGTSVTEGARALKFAGLDNQMIADVLNTSPATVRTLTTKLRANRSARARRKRKR